MAPITAKCTCLASSARLQRSSHTVSVIANNAWIFGGELHPRQPVDNQFDVVELSKASAAVQTIPAQGEAPTPRVGSASTVLGDAIYFFSGRGGMAMAPIEENGQLWSYKPSTSQWSLVSPADVAAPYPAARSYHAMTNNGNSTIYVHAGCPESGRLSDLWSFDVNTRTWKSLADAPNPPRGGTSIAYCAGKLYRMNGFDGKQEQGGNLDVYDPSQDSWSVVPYPADGKNGPEARSVSALLPLQLDGKPFLVTLFGERDPSSLGHAGAGKMLGDVWAYDVELGIWSKVEASGELPPPRGWFDADVVADVEMKDAIVVHGGLAEDNSRLGDVWIIELDA
ncbi:kelch repeat protein [Rhizodiscina lignyota]|uniref:Kelch repeat protein n=1 Tax=Rhizodiscina lignyota TaxID=1504668 RepID=A0A9P4I3J7_9PEZI|nr:kelch repeat protein [Rhizodiscina lignyota]